MVSSHPDGHTIATDMPVELGGAGDAVSPGWLWRSGLAACTTTCIAMLAARRGLALDTLEVEVTSRSDVRGALGMTEPDGATIYGGPRNLEMRVRIAARGVQPHVLRTLVADGQRVSPMSSGLVACVQMGLRVEIETD